MDSKRLKQIEEIYHAALEISPKEREAFFAEYCGEDESLRHEVESLLSFSGTSDNLLNASPKTLAAEMFSDEEQDDFSGKKIGHYKIQRLLGKGGMGEVYLAKDEKLQRSIALKILPTDFANDAERMSRFVQEARAASALNHANIITIYEISESEGINFIATEYIEGTTLTEYLQQEQLNFKTVLDIAIQITSALVAAHEAGIIHRDIKPDNVMIRKDGTVKVVDFGIAKPSDQHSEANLDREAATRQKVMTKPGMIMGTPQYMSPEQARGRKVDSRTDIFSFGIVLYEMIANKTPFSGENEFDTIGSILKEEPKPLKDYFSEIPERLEQIVSKALQKKPDTRYQSMKELYIDLNYVRDNLDTDLKLIHETAPDKTRKTLKTNNSIITEQRFSVIHLLFFLLGISAVVGTIWWLTSSPNTNQTASQLKSEEIFNWASKPGEFYSEGTFSPDAKMVAFVSTKGGEKGIWVKRTTSGEAVQITKDKVDYRNPIWSPNGDELAFFSSKGDKAGFWQIPTLGGTPKLIAAIDDGSSRLLSWSKANQIYYESKGDIYSVNTDSGQTKQISELASSDVQGTSLSISPDKKSIAYTKTKDKVWSLWASDLENKTPKNLLSSESEIRNTVWHPDNERLFFSQLVDGAFQIFVTDINGGKTKQISNFKQDSFVSDISSDGTKILYGSAKEESDVWKVDLAKSKESNVVSDIDSELWADVSPDGKTLVYQSIKNLSQGNNLLLGKVLAKKLETNETPTELADSGFLPSWSPNGQTVAYASISGDQYQIEAIKSNGGEKKILAKGIYPVLHSILPYNRLETSYFNWSPDSEKIIYVSMQSGQSNIWMTTVNSSNNTQLTENKNSNITVNCPIWSVDGKFIAFTTSTNNLSGAIIYSVQVFDVETKVLRFINTQDSYMRLLGWSSDDSKLIMASVDNSQTSSLPTEISLLQMQIETGKTQEISKLEDTYKYNIYLSPDKKNIAFVANRENKDNIWVIPTLGGKAKQFTNNSDSRLYFSSLAWSPDNSSIFFGKQMRYSLLSMLKDYK